MARIESGTAQAWDDFHSVVNMTSPELRDWLATPYGAADAVGEDLYQLGRRLPEIMAKRESDLTGDDVEVMRRVTERVWGLLGDATPAAGRQDHAWRHALMTLGHDPLRPDSPRRDELE